MKRVPIMVERTPILTEGEKYFTIASLNKDYKPYEIMGSYPDITSARSHYQDDMNEMRKSGKRYLHFAIKKVTINSSKIGGES